MSKPGHTRAFMRGTDASSYALHLSRQLGSLGAAGPCKRIDPKTGAVIEVLQAHSGEIEWKGKAHRWPKK